MSGQQLGDKHLTPTLTTDGRVDLAGYLLEAAQVERLIQALAVARAQMDPPVTRSWSASETIEVVGDPAFKIGLTHEGRLLLAIRHEGFGWCCFDFDLQMAAQLRDFIAGRTTGIKSVTLDETPSDDRASH
jgi:hypothetical protein